MKSIYTLIAMIIGFTITPLVIHAQELIEYKSGIVARFPEWNRQFPKLNFKDFEEVSTKNLLEESANYSEHTWEDYVSKYKVFMSYAPNKKYFIDVISNGIDVEIKNGKYYASADVDQGVLLGDVKSKKVYIIAFCGPSCRYEEAQWLDDNTAVLIGNYNEESNKYVHTIAIVDLVTMKITHYYNNNPNATSTKTYKGKPFRKLTYN